MSTTRAGSWGSRAAPQLSCSSVSSCLSPLYLLPLAYALPLLWIFSLPLSPCFLPACPALSHVFLAAQAPPSCLIFAGHTSYFSTGILVGEVHFLTPGHLMATDWLRMSIPGSVLASWMPAWHVPLSRGQGSWA